MAECVKETAAHPDKRCGPGKNRLGSTLPQDLKEEAIARLQYVYAFHYRTLKLQNLMIADVTRFLDKNKIRALRDKVIFDMVITAMTSAPPKNAPVDEVLTDYLRCKFAYQPRTDKLQKKIAENARKFLDKHGPELCWPRRLEIFTKAVRDAMENSARVDEKLTRYLRHQYALQPKTPDLSPEMANRARHFINVCAPDLSWSRARNMLYEAVAAIIESTQIDEELSAYLQVKFGFTPRTPELMAKKAYKYLKQYENLDWDRRRDILFRAVEDANKKLLKLSEETPLGAGAQQPPFD